MFFQTYKALDRNYEPGVREFTLSQLKNQLCISERKKKQNNKKALIYSHSKAGCLATPDTV